MCPSTALGLYLLAARQANYRTMDDLSSQGLHAAILAAGPSTRFGSPKQLVRLGGSPVLHQAVSNASFVAGHSVTVVLGANARDVTAALRQSAASIVLNRDWEEGLASSIRVAVRTAPPGCSGMLLMLADQVALTADDLKRLFAAWRRHPILIAAALYGGAPGLPAIFPRWPFSDLMELRGDRDPRLVLRRSVDRLVRVPMQNAGVDLDTPEDLLLIESGTGGHSGPGLG
jgi:molybdenum cofactor cytidylyltransferase